MAIDTATLALEIQSSQVTQAQEALDRLTTSAGTAETATGKLGLSFERLGSFVTQAFAVVGVTFGARELINDIQAQETALALLNQRILATGGAAGYTGGQLNAFADALAKQTGLSQTAILQAETMLLTFQRIGHDTFPQALKATLDLSVGMGRDLGNAALTVGRLLENPDKAMLSLSRTGIVFSQQLIEQVKQLEANGRSAQAMGLLLDDLHRKTGDAADAFGITLGGALGKLRGAFESAAESIGSGGLSKAISDIAKTITDFVNNNPDAMTHAGYEIGQAAHDAADQFTYWASKIKEVVDILNQVKAFADSAGNATGGFLSKFAPGNILNTLTGKPTVVLPAFQPPTAQQKLQSLLAEPGAEMPLGATGAGGKTDTTPLVDAGKAAETAKAIAEQRALNTELAKQNVLLAATDTLMRADILTTSEQGRNLAANAEYYKALAQTGSKAVADLAAGNVRLKFTQSDLLEASKLLNGIADPYQKLGVQLKEVDRLEKAGSLTSHQAALLRIADSDAVLKSERATLQGLIDTNAVLTLQARQAVTPAGGGSTQQLAAMQKLITAQKESDFLLANPTVDPSSFYGKWALSVIDATQAETDLNASLTHAIALFNQSLTPMQKYQRTLADIATTSAAHPDILDSGAVKRLSDQALETAAGITPAYKEMRQAVQDAGNAIFSSFNKAIVSGGSFKDMLTGITTDFQNIALQWAETGIMDFAKKSLFQMTATTGAGGTTDPNSWLGKFLDTFGLLEHESTASLVAAGTGLNSAAAAQIAAAQALMAAAAELGASGGLGSLGALLPFAGTGLSGSNIPFSDLLSGALGMGGFTPFASGGVVDKPTRALVGEAGPEAVVPLSRMPSMGGGKVTNNINIVNTHSSAEVQTKQKANDQGGADIEVMIVEKVANDIQKGGRVFRAMKQATGASMKPISRG